MPGLQRVAVVDPTGNVGGGSRFVRSLLPALTEVRPELQVTFFGNHGSMERDAVPVALRAAGVEVAELEWIAKREWKTRPLPMRFKQALKRSIGRGRDRDAYVHARLVRELNDIGQAFDVVYYPWPYLLPVPKSDVPVVSTIHDLNFKYFFGTPVYGPARSLKLDGQLAEWLARSTVITSSTFMAGEIERFFPGSRTPHVVRLTSFAGTGDVANDVAPRVRAPYILCANNVTVHKNLGSVIAAHALLKERHPDLTLVIAGAGTEEANGRATATGVARGLGDDDVVGLGYVSNEMIDQLIAGALAVVNASLYEAGNGPGLDAWSIGTPVAMSDIPAFREHLEVLGVEAAVFDPRSPSDIAERIHDIIEHRDAWAAAAERSRTAMQARTWKQVASEYLAVFDAALASAR